MYLWLVPVNVSCELVHENDPRYSALRSAKQANKGLAKQQLSQLYLGVLAGLPMGLCTGLECVLGALYGTWGSSSLAHGPLHRIGVCIGRIVRHTGF